MNNAIPINLREAAEKLVSGLHELLEHHSRTKRGIHFDHHTTNCVMRFVDALGLIDGGSDEIARRASIMCFNPPSEHGRRLVDSWNAIRDDVVTLYDSMKPEDCTWELSGRLELTLRGFRFLQKFVQFDDFLSYARNGSVPLSLFNLDEFRASLERSFDPCDSAVAGQLRASLHGSSEADESNDTCDKFDTRLWPDEWADRLSAVLENADALWIVANREKAVACRQLLAIRRRDPEPMPQKNEIEEMVVAVESLTLWASCRESNAAHPTTGQDSEATHIDDEAFLSATRLAALLNSKAEPVRKKLERFRRKNLDGWVENTERGPNDPRFVYRYGAVKHLFTQK